MRRLLADLTTLKTTALVCILVLAITASEGKRSLGGSNRKSSGSSYTTRRQPSSSVTKPSFNTHAEQAKLSYPNYNAQPNRPASAPSPNSQQNIGWTNPNQGGHAGPPPAYSPGNVAGGAHTNIHEPPPVYQKPNYGAAPPPHYNQATGNQYGSPNNIPPGATYHSPGNLPPGATYHTSGHVPAGATYYPSGSHVPSGGYPAGGYPAGGHTYYPAGGMPAGASYYASPGALPPGATFLPAGSSLPAGATYYPSPQGQSSSGPGLGTGLIAGALGGAILGHVLTPTQTRVVEHAPASTNSGNSDSDRIIIINNSGQPVNATDVNGATVITTGGQAAPAPAAGNAEVSAPLAPIAPIPVTNTDNATNTPLLAPMDNNATNAASVTEPPPPGGIICVPVRVNETDPNDSTKMIEVEKVACYPAPPPPPVAPITAADTNSSMTNPVSSDGSAPLAPLQDASHTQATLLAEQSPVRQAPSKANWFQQDVFGLMITTLISYMIANAYA